MIYTSYFANWRKFPEGAVPIAISGGVPAGYKGLWTKQLAPKWSWFQEWKNGAISNTDYVINYKRDVLDHLSPEVMEYKLRALACGAEDIILLCYEKPGDFCHRHLVADWFNAAGIKVEEL